MLHIENLHVGQWIIVSSVKEEDIITYEVYPFGRNVNRRTRAVVDGRPLKILGISLPYFLAVSDGVQRFSLDLRECTVMLAHRKYVKEMLPRMHMSWVGGEVVEGSPISLEEWCKQKDKDEKPSYRNQCPMCGQIMVERLNNETSRWFLVCRECGFEGGPGADKERS